MAGRYEADLTHPGAGEFPVRRWLIPLAAIGLAGTLGGCVAYPAYPAYGYGPGYVYEPPPVVVGVGGGWGWGHHWHGGWGGWHGGHHW
jgi:hypothetical protein